MKTFSRSFLRFASLSLVFGLGLSALSAPASAEVVRTGPRGNTSTTERSIENGHLDTTTTGPEGHIYQSTTTSDGQGTITHTTTGPQGQSATSTHEVSVEDGEITRESTGPMGRQRTVTRSRNE